MLNNRVDTSCQNGKTAFTSRYTRFSKIEWDMIMRLRDIISHHYDTIDHEIIYDICRRHIPLLKKTIKQIIEDFA